MRSRQTHARLVQLAQRSQENGEGVSSGRCEVNNSVCVISVGLFVYLHSVRMYVGVVVCVDSLSSVFVCVHTAEFMFMWQLFHQFIMQFLLRVIK